MTTAKQPGEQPPRIEVLDPDEALRRAKPLPPLEQIQIPDVSEDEWELFRQAIKS